MNEKTRTQIEEMKKQTIGVEVEMYNITREKACRIIAAYFGTENTVRYIGGSYSAWTSFYFVKYMVEKLLDICVHQR